MINNFEDLKNEVKASLNILVSMNGVSDLDSRGNGICPFHTDHKKGAFKVRALTNTYKCFACGASGDALDIEQHKRNLSFIDTVYEIGYEMNLICFEEYKKRKIIPEARAYGKFIGGTQKQTITNFRPNVVNPVLRPEKKELTGEEIELYDLTYRVLGKYCGLDSNDLEHLIAERLVGSDRLADFFSLRDLSDKKAIEKTVTLLNKKGIDNDKIVQVPGFTYNKKGEVCLSSYIRGLAMKVRNAEGKVIGIQVRTEIQDKKYLWLSSSSKGGSGCSTPLAVEYPKMIVEDGLLNIEKTVADTTKTLFITEGKFKAISLCKNFNAITFGIAGINNWRGKVKKDFELINSIREFNKIIVFADADTAYNPNIFLQFKEMLEVELKGFKGDIIVAYWNIENGKGIDDVINNGLEDNVNYMMLDEYNELYSTYVVKLQEFSNKVTDDKDKKINTYNKIFSI